MAIVIKTQDKEQIAKIIKEKNLIYVDYYQEPYEYLVRSFYKTSNGETFVFEERPKPIPLQYKNTNTPKIAIQTFVKMFTELISKVSKNEPDDDINKSITRTQTPIQKLKRVLKKDYENEVVLDRAVELTIIGATTKTFKVFKEQKNISVIDTIDKILSFPQMSDNPDNAFLKSSLNSLKVVSVQKEATAENKAKAEENETDKEIEAE